MVLPIVLSKSSEDCSAQEKKRIDEIEQQAKRDEEEFNKAFKPRQDLDDNRGGGLRITDDIR